MSFLADKLSNENVWLSLLYHAIAGFIFPAIILMLKGDLESITKLSIHFAIFFSFFSMSFWAIDQGMKRAFPNK